MIEIDNYSEILKLLEASDREFKHKVIFGYWNISNGKREFVASKTIQNGIKNLKINQAYNSSNDNILMGCVCSSSCTIEFYNTSIGDSFSDRVMQVQCGIKKEDGNFEYITLGYFSTGKAETDDDWYTVKINAYDDINSFTQKWKTELDYSKEITIKDILKELTGEIPYEVDLFTEDNSDKFLNRIITENELGLLLNFTKREVLGYIAGLGGGNAKMTNIGKIRIGFYKKSNPLVKIKKTIQWQNGFKKLQSKNFKIKSVSSGAGEIVYTKGTGEGITFINPLIIEEDVENIYYFASNDIYIPEFMPCECEWRGNPCIEVGDIVGIEDKNGDILYTLVTNQELDLTGGLSSKINCPKGDREISFQTNTVTPLELKKQYTDLQEEIKKATGLINSASGGFYELLDVDSDSFPDGWLIKEHSEITSETGIIRANTAGIGLSINGGTTYKTAITFDGIVADAITTGNLNAENVIVAGWNISDKGFVRRDKSGYFTYLGSVKGEYDAVLVSGASNNGNFFDGSLNLFTDGIIRLGTLDENHLNLTKEDIVFGSSIAGEANFAIGKGFDGNQNQGFRILSYDNITFVSSGKYRAGNLAKIQATERTKVSTGVPVASGDLKVTGNITTNSDDDFELFAGLTHNRKNSNFNASVGLGCGSQYYNPSGAIEVRNLNDSNSIVARLDVFNGNPVGYNNATLLSLGKLYAYGYIFVDNGAFHLLDSADSDSVVNASKHKNLWAGNIYSNGVKVTSTENVKTDITPQSSTIDLFRPQNSGIYSYKYIKNQDAEKSSDSDFSTASVDENSTLDSEKKMCYGFVIGENYNTPREVISDDGKHINLYSMASLNWKATQELLEKLEQAESKIQALEKRNEAS